MSGVVRVGTPAVSKLFPALGLLFVIHLGPASCVSICHQHHILQCVQRSTCSGSGEPTLDSASWNLCLPLRGGSDNNASAAGPEAITLANVEKLSLDDPRKKSKAPPKSFARRDMLLELQRTAQERWEREKIFEADAPTDTSPDKYFVTFPYPYMNGRLHLGHAFSLTKAEFAVGFHRLQGRRCLWPFAFHCTGMPIQAAADSLRRFIDSQGDPPPPPPPEDSRAAAGAQPEEACAAEEERAEEEGLAGAEVRHGGKKSKLMAKKGGGNPWEALASIGVPPSEIPSFVDPAYWLSYFPPRAKEDLRAMGLQIDWRRSFVTTEAEPMYDAFVRWQFRRLQALGKIVFGKRLSVFSPLDQQICADHDRASGEGIGPQEYTLVKLRLLELPPALEQLREQSDEVVLLAATLRPETMYGQTNCWVKPHEKDGADVWYGCYKTHRAGEIAIVGEHAARNMAFQGLSPEFARVSCLLKVRGRDLLGLPLSSPLAPKSPIYSLPLLHILMDKGTGVVTSVPSDSPEDFIALRDLQRKPALRDKYGVRDECVAGLEPSPVIRTPYRNDSAADDAATVHTECAAQLACAEYKVASQNDRAGLAKAKAKTYKLGFYEGTMAAGAFAGEAVRDAKVKVRQQLLEAGDAYAYAEPEREVVSRSGDVCVVALTDQWYINYADPEWKAQVRSHMEGVLETYSADTKARFEKALAWLEDWGCSRSFGLGSRLPWDESFVIESLSDSTMYTAFYTVAHILKGTADGSVPVQAGDITDEDWDFIFLGGPMPENTKLEERRLSAMRREVQFWYPVDLRVSGRDLIQNHLTFFLYTHAAMFPREQWPRSIRTNGFVMLDNAKMSKQTGNFLTLRDGILQYSADAMRFALALAGDSNEDANFEHDVANAAILKLTTELAFVEKTLEAASEGEVAKDQHSGDGVRSGPTEALLVDRLFANDIARHAKEAEHCYARLQFREALIQAWDLLQQARDRYRSMTASLGGMHGALLRSFVQTQTLLIAPICPHYAEHVWTLLGHRESVMRASWPQLGAVDPVLSRVSLYLDKVVPDLRATADRLRGKKSMLGGVIWVGTKYLEWQQAALQVLAERAAGGGAFDKGFKREMLSLPALAPFKAHAKQLLPFAQFCIDDFHLRGSEAFELSLPFDEQSILTETLPFLRDHLALSSLAVETWPPADTGSVQKKTQAPLPGRPTITLS